MNQNNSQVSICPSKVFFPNLNGVRFIAAFMVIVQHVEDSMKEIGFPTYYKKLLLGQLGVTLFFVLSGFLITYLLLSEKKYDGTISLNYFYVRRILRIWPLYFIIIMLGFWFIPNLFPILTSPKDLYNLSNQFYTQLLLNSFFLSNVSIILFPPPQLVRQLWSVGVEEQFYLIWPLIIKYIRNTIKPLSLILVVMIGANILIITIGSILEKDLGSSSLLIKALLFSRIFITHTRIDCMAVGGMGAWLLFENKTNILTILYSKQIQLLAYFMFIISLLYLRDFIYINYLPYSILYIVIILNLASNKNSIININNRFFDYMGKISYGLYMYHPIAIAISIKLILLFIAPLLIKTKFEPLEIATMIINYLIVMMVVTLISALSYNFLEKYFLTMKLKFSYIISGDNAKN